MVTTSTTIFAIRRCPKTISKLQRLQPTLTIRGPYRSRLRMENPLLERVRTTRALKSNSNHDWLNQRKVSEIARAFRVALRNAIPGGDGSRQAKPHPSARQ